jgi:hypothetical protein
MFIPFTKAQRIDESLCMFVAGRDGCTANAEHWRQQRRHICVVYVPPMPCALGLACWPCSGPWQLNLGEY